MALVSQLRRSAFRSSCTNAPRPCGSRGVVMCHAQSRSAERLLKSAGSSACALLAGAALLLDAGSAHAAGRERVSEFTASGLLFKDVVEVTAVEDPEIDGLTIYFSDFKRNIVDKLQKDFFAEPSQASLTCVVTGPVTVKDPKRISSFEGEEVFSEQKGLNIFKNKTLRVRRVYDADRRTVIYVAYSTRLSTASDEGGVTTGRYRTSMCAVPLPPPVTAPPLTTSTAAAATTATAAS
ncbi:hypothetical protein Agub_g11865 [Astrephomene gubernaculifera]|uniref:CreA protein n=1 Tax=Astrephomene gubernaculifera TaxID=47775 RepID=A0AAD3E1L4_9CHLO|nr:hypothetical protein Agub_g11865 [Astrephomene gubernaculifera]